MIGRHQHARADRVRPPAVRVREQQPAFQRLQRQRRAVAAPPCRARCRPTRDARARHAGAAGRPRATHRSPRPGARARHDARARSTARRAGRPDRHRTSGSPSPASSASNSPTSSPSPGSTKFSEASRVSTSTRSSWSRDLGQRVVQEPPRVRQAGVERDGAELGAHLPAIVARRTLLERPLEVAGGGPRQPGRDGALGGGAQVLADLGIAVRAALEQMRGDQPASARTAISARAASRCRRSRSVGISSSVIAAAISACANRFPPDRAGPRPAARPAPARARRPARRRPRPRRAARASPITASASATPRSRGESSARRRRTTARATARPPRRPRSRPRRARPAATVAARRRWHSADDVGAPDQLRGAAQRQRADADGDAADRLSWGRPRASRARSAAAGPRPAAPGTPAPPATAVGPLRVVDDQRQRPPVSQLRAQPQHLCANSVESPPASSRRAPTGASSSARKTPNGKWRSSGAGRRAARASRCHPRAPQPGRAVPSCRVRQGPRRRRHRRHEPRSRSARSSTARSIKAEGAAGDPTRWSVRIFRSRSSP